MNRITAWIALGFGVYTMAYALIAKSLVGNAELPLTSDERNRLLRVKPSIRVRVAGVCLGFVFCIYGIYGLIH